MGDDVFESEQTRELQRLLRRARGLERRVAELEDELDRAHRLATLGTMAGAVAHEFNNILTPILSYAQVAMVSPDDRELTDRALQKVVSGAEKAGQIVGSMLGLIRDGEEATTADVAAVIEQARSCLVRDPAKDGIEVVVHAPPGCRAAIRPLALEQVLLNLLSNACDAMRPAPGTINISVRRSTWNTDAEPPRGIDVDDGITTLFDGLRRAERHETPDSIDIRVVDTGPGIPREIAADLFKPLVSRKQEGADHRGTGLGLAICKRLIDEAGGAIRVRSAPGIGTVFTIRLPAAPAPSRHEHDHAA